MSSSKEVPEAEITVGSEIPALAASQEGEAVPIDELRAAAAVIGFDASDDDLASIGPLAAANRALYRYPRRHPLADGAGPFPALVFDPIVPGVRAHADPTGGRRWQPRRPSARPVDVDGLAFADLATLAGLVRARRVSCRQLAETSLARLERLDPTLRCVVTLTAERALARADALDAELAAGRWRGPLHGIPWGAKDLIAVEGSPTTWGSPPWRDQRPADDATVVSRLDEAGAVLVAKLSTGELAMGDSWFGGRTRNPWDPEQGSSGSSAGPASATAAGAVAFALGTETYGSIVSPSSVCGCSSLRPTFGRVSRTGVMALAWSLDKVGPMARNVADLGPVLAAIDGGDGVDPTVVARPFVPPGRVDVAGWRVGVSDASFEQFDEDRHVLEELASLGVELVPVELPRLPTREMLLAVVVESAAAFDELTRADRLRELAVQDGWPKSFLAARFVPAVEYLRGMRLRTELMVAMEQVMDGLDAIVHPTGAVRMLSIGNLTGRPTVAAPCGFESKPPSPEQGSSLRTPRSISFTGQLFGESRLLALAAAWQRATSHHLEHPAL